MISIRNFDEFIEKKNYINLNPLAPQHPYRLLITGPSGQGKTNLSFNLIFELTYWERLYVVSKMVNSEDKYIKLQDWIKKIEYDVQEELGSTDLEIGFFYSKFEELPDVDSLDETKQNLILIDDMITVKNQEKIEEYFIRSRKKNCSIIYLTQSFYRTPKLIRDNCSDFAFFNVESKRELQEISKTVATRVPYEKFVQLYQECVSQQHGFIYISRRDTQLLKHIRCGFTGLLINQKIK
jgi:hypothetical protein